MERGNDVEKIDKFDILPQITFLREAQTAFEFILDEFGCELSEAELDPAAKDDFFQELPRYRAVLNTISSATDRLLEALEVRIGER